MRPACCADCSFRVRGGVIEGAAANGDSLYLECPCEVESDGTTLRLTAGLRSYRAVQSTSLYLGVRTINEPGRPDFEVASVPVADFFAAGATLESATYDVEFEIAFWRHTEAQIELVLYEGDPETDLATVRDRVHMDGEVDLDRAFQVKELDLLEDTDGDGVGDVNERLEGTDSADSAATPGDSTIDVLVLYSQSVPDLYGGDPTARIQHVFSLANRMLLNSNVQLRLRVVGLVGVEINESGRYSGPYTSFLIEEADRHGADLVVLFRPPTASIPACGFAFIGGDGRRGVFRLRRMSNFYATVMAGCGAGTLAHETGHLMGLGHTVWESAPTGTWRWSRGHGVDHDFGTIMSYGPGVGTGTALEVFSDPEASCTGRQGLARPCGVDRKAVNGADAVTSLNAVRFQVARFRESYRDADGDGYVDPVDDLPANSAEWLDTDGNGVGDNSDADDDGDGVIDTLDIFPLDGREWEDTDSDGTGDNADAFPEDPDEVSDRDGDLVGDNNDRFPGDSSEWLDSDGDGVGDNGDLWPNDPRESTDTDGDGLGNNRDLDDDGDGIDDDADLFPLDAARRNIASYQFVGERSGDSVGRILSGGGSAHESRVAIGAPNHDANGRSDAGAVYFLAGPDLATLDAADGRVDRAVGLEHAVSGAQSWKILGDSANDNAGGSVSASGDLDGDGLVDLVIGASGAAGRGAAWLLSGADLGAADAADGAPDHVIGLAHVAAQPNSWQFLGADGGDEAGGSVAAIPDIDGDGLAELVVGAIYHQSAPLRVYGAVYLIASADLGTADLADGTADGVIDLANATRGSNSWKLADGTNNGRIGSNLATFDFNGDGITDIIIGAPSHPAPSSGGSFGAVYLIAVADLAAADGADGASDRVVDVGRIVEQPNSWKLYNGTGQGWTQGRVALAGKTGDSAGWLVAGQYVVSAADLAAADTVDGVFDGAVQMQNLLLEPDSMRIHAQHVGVVGDADGDGGNDILAGDWLLRGLRLNTISASRLRALDPSGIPPRPDGVIWRGQLQRQADAWTMESQVPFDEFFAASAGDVDGDGRTDHLLGVTRSISGDSRGAVRLLLAGDVSGLDRADGVADRRMLLDNIAGDTDGDGVDNTLDRDDDNDGFPDVLDTFPLDPAEWVDTDQDRVGDNADAFPYDNREQSDTDGDDLGNRYQDDDDDGDGIPDLQDRYPLDTDNDGIPNAEDSDDDNDGIADVADGLPLDATESLDTDGDGFGNNADMDDDGDGVPDSDDALPLDARDSVDTDGDGIGDTTDVFPSDAAETADFDGDGIGDNADSDDDNNGVADADDVYPFDSTASKDTDGDGVPDSRDRYPTHPGEWANSDNAGFGDNRDTDDDNDGVRDVDDVFPLDRTRWNLTSYRVRLSDESVALLNHNMAAAGDIDGDGNVELLIRPPAPGSANDLVYIFSLSDLSSADTLDGTGDGSLFIRHASSQTGSWRLVGQPEYSTTDHLWGLGDLGGDGGAYFFVSAGAKTSVGHLVSGSDLVAADAADGSADGAISQAHLAAQPGSWTFRGFESGGVPTVSGPADVDGDGGIELAISQAGTRDGDGAGSVLTIPFDSLGTIDALDGSTDGTLAVTSMEDHALWQLIGEARADYAGTRVEMADFDGDGQVDFVVGAPGHDTSQLDAGAVYLLSGNDLESADLADQVQDGRIELGRVGAQPNSFKLAGNAASGRLGQTLIAEDINGDGRPDLALIARTTRTFSVGTVLPWNPDRLTGMDEADGTADGMIALENVSRAHGAFRSPPIERFTDLGMTDFDGDGRHDLLIGVDSIVGRTLNVSGTVAYAVNASWIFGDDADSITADTRLEDIAATGGSYRIYAPELFYLNEQAYVRIASADDIDGDGLGEILLSVMPISDAAYRSVYLLNGADLAFLDSSDGRADGLIFLSSILRTRR